MAAAATKRSRRNCSGFKTEKDGPKRYRMIRSHHESEFNCTCVPKAPLPHSQAQQAQQGQQNRAFQLIRSTQEAGVDIFHFALFPEGESMRAYNRTNPDACFTHFTAPEVWATGSAQAYLSDLLSQLHSEDQPEMISYIQAHLKKCHQGIGLNEIQRFTSNRFRARNAQGNWGWHEVRSRIYRHESGLVITEGVMTEITEVMELLLKDSLTQLPNRLATEQRLQLILDRNPQASLAVINLDVDRFQSINDRFGQVSGDAVLQHVANTLQRQLPSSAWLARLEADEFLLMLHPDPTGAASGSTTATDHAKAQRAAHSETDLASQAEAAVLHWQEMLMHTFAKRSELPLRLTVSAGAAVYSGGVTYAKQLLQQANTALMEAKRRGPASYCLYSSGISEAIEQRLLMEKNLDLAIERKDFELLYQPQMDRNGRLIAAEALLRWSLPDGRVMDPDFFIPIAEQTGQIRAVSQWVLETACAQLSHWQQRGLQPPKLALNLSAVQLEPTAEEPALVNVLLEACRRHGITPDQLDLEITETAVLHDRELALQQLNAVVSAGFGLAIDDFGTGYSCLQTLRSFPVHFVKIDKSFVQQLPNSFKDQQLVEAVLVIARQLQLQTVAEGVETEAQWQLLQELGCDNFQGYLFAKPLTSNAMAELMKAAPTQS
jgi:diguanylate cyclase (GGDEF)-like protein